MFLSQLQICGSSSACRKKTLCRRMAPVLPFWDICQWQNFPGNSNTWLNTSSKRFFLLRFLQPKKNVQKSMLLHWCCPLRGTTSLTTWKKGDFCEFLKKKYHIECFKILQIYLCINNEYKVIFSDENIRFSASYPPSPESSKKKVFPLLQWL